MSKNDSSTDTDTGTKNPVTDPDPVQISSAAVVPESTTADATTDATTDAPADASVAVTAADSSADLDSAASPLSQELRPSSRRAWFGVFNFLLILLLAGAGGYYWWQQQQLAKAYEATIDGLRQELRSKAGNSQLATGLAPLKSGIDGLEKKIKTLTLEQQGLQASSAKLYELYGRDKNDWQLAEVEYLLRVAQHKLILQDDFSGAAITLQAASDKINLTGDPGLLPVRVVISEEIAELKTRRRTDLVGASLLLTQLGRQLPTLKPGFAVRIDESTPTPSAAETSQAWYDTISHYLNSLVTIRNEVTRPSATEASQADVGAKLADNLKLARWAVLERNNSQYQQLIAQSLRQFRDFYDLDDAANHGFLTQLQELQKMVLQPEKPDITGSLRELQRILSQRENAPAESPSSAEGGND